MTTCTQTATRVLADTGHDGSGHREKGERRPRILMLNRTINSSSYHGENQTSDASFRMGSLSKLEEAYCSCSLMRPFRLLPFAPHRDNPKRFPSLKKFVGEILALYHFSFDAAARRLSNKTLLLFTSFFSVGSRVAECLFPPLSSAESGSSSPQIDFHFLVT